MKKYVMLACVAVIAVMVNARDRAELYGGWMHMQQTRADPDSKWNKRMDFLQGMVNRQMVQNMQNDGGQMMYGMQQRDPMAEFGRQLGLELRDHIQWFVNFGEAALQNNRLEYALRLVRLQQLQQTICNVPGCGEIANNLQQVVNFLQELYVQTEP